MGSGCNSVRCWGKARKKRGKKRGERRKGEGFVLVTFIDAGIWQCLFCAVHLVYSIIAQPLFSSFIFSYFHSSPSSILIQHSKAENENNNGGYPPCTGSSARLLRTYR